MASVTGQLYSSERIIDEWLAALKSDHIPDAPVRLTVTAPLPSACSGFFKSSAARTISLVSAFAPPRTIAVRPSAETVTPGRGGITIATRGSVRRRASTSLMTCWARGVSDLPAVGVHDHHQRRAARAAELLLHELADGHRLRPARLPTRAGQHVLRLRSEHGKTRGDQQPGDQRHPEVGRRPGTQAAQRAGPPRLRGGVVHAVRLSSHQAQRSSSPESSWASSLLP